MKRFYSRAGFEPLETGFAVTLDGKPVRTPNRARLVLPGPALAALVAAEWDAQGDTVRPATMRVTKLATTVVDLMPARRGDAIDEILGHAQTDLLCYRAAEPETLRLRQALLWQPWLDRAADVWGVSLAFTYGVSPIEQPATGLAALRERVEALDPWRLVAAHATVTGTGSIVLGLAMVEGALGAEQAVAAATIDEHFAAERWGEDPEEAARRTRLADDLGAAERYLHALASDLPNG